MNTIGRSNPFGPHRRFHGGGLARRALNLVAACAVLALLGAPAAAVAAGNATTGGTLFNSAGYGCSGCHTPTSAPRPNGSNAPAILLNAQSAGMNGGYTQMTGTDPDDIAAYLAQQNPATTSTYNAGNVNYNGSTSITPPDIFFGSYSALDRIVVVSGPTKGTTNLPQLSNSFTYTATCGQTGTDTFTVRGNNGGALSTSTRTVQVNILGAASPPTITSAGTASGTSGGTLSPGYTITATPCATSFGGSGLPPGLGVNPSTGAITGTIASNSAGTYNATVSATGGGQTANKSVTFTVALGTPIVTGATLNGVLGGPFPTYTVTATESPTSFTVIAGALPPGLSLNPANGQITGTPTAGGPYSATIQATNSFPKSGSAVFNFNIATLPPVLTGGTVNSLTGASVNYTIQAINAPTLFSLVTALPPGLTLSDPTAGVISGIPTTPGTFNTQVTASNGAGAGNIVTITFNITLAPPVITSPGSAGGATGQPFSYQITADNAPITAYGATGLPPGLSVSAATGLISGTPTSLGSFNATISATNSTATTNATLVITIADGTPGFYGPTSVNGTFGQPFSYQLLATFNPTVYGATGLPPGLTLNTTTGVVSGTPTVGGTYLANLSASNVAGTGSTVLRFVISSVAPGVADVTAAVTFQTATPITLPVTGEFTRVNIVSLPAHGLVATSGPAGTVVTYTPASGFAGHDSFTYSATGPGGTSATATVTITIGSVKPVAAPIALNAAIDGPTTVDVASFITGSLVTGVAITSQPLHGTASVSGTRVTYTPHAGFFGQDAFSYVAFGDAGTSAPAVVTVTIVGRPDPTRDPAVTGLLDAQAQTARRFSRAQITNFQRRMESLHVPSPVTRAPANAAEGAPAPVPPTTPAASAAGLRDKIAGQAGTAPAARPGSALESAFAGMVSGFASSRSLNLSGSTDGRASGPLGGVSFWVGGTASFGTRSLGDEFGSFRFSTDGISVGADRRLNDRLALGVGLGFARDRSDILGDGTNNRSRGRSFAAYGTYHPSPRTYLDTVLGFGSLTFDSERWVASFDDVARASRKGDQFFGSVAYGYEYRTGATLVSPYGRLDVTEDRLKRATESGAGAAALAYDEQKLRTTSATAGLRIESTHETDYGRVTPRARVEFRHDFEGSRSASLSYADQYQGLTYSVTPAGSTRNALVIGIGADFLLGRGWKAGVDYQGERTSGPGTVQSVRFLVSKDLDDKGFPAWSGWSMPLAIPVDVDGGMLWDSNIGRGRLASEVRSDRIYTFDATRTYEFPLSAHTRVLATANLEVDKPHTYTGFGRFSAGGKAEYQYRASGDFDATTWAAYARGSYDKFESNLRTGPAYAVGVNARRSLTDRIDLFADVSLLRRYGRSSVFETRETAARFNLDYSLGKTGTAYLSGEYRKGDAVSTGFPSLTNLALADVAVQDDAFDGGEFFSYRFDARTVLGTLGFNMPLGARDSIDLSVRRVQTTPTMRPAFDDGSRLRYIVNQYSLLYLLRF